MAKIEVVTNDQVFSPDRMQFEQVVIVGEIHANDSRPIIEVISTGDDFVDKIIRVGNVFVPYLKFSGYKVVAEEESA